jgi:ribonuclease III
MSDLADLEARLGYRFRDRSILDLALRHRSHGHEGGSPDLHNERLEFLGDALLGFVVAERLFQAAGGRGRVGDLSRRRAELVSAASLAARARALSLGAHLRLGKGEEGSGGREKESLLADALEAVVAAIYLDGGLEAARRFIAALFANELSGLPPAPLSDPKSALQESLQARGLSVPEYRVVAESGNAQEPLFEVEVLSEGAVLGRGEGRTKKAAETEAARSALRGPAGAPPPRR